jgi:hypothetical protein
MNIRDTDLVDTSQEDHFGDAWAYFYHDQYSREAVGGAAPIIILTEPHSAEAVITEWQNIFLRTKKKYIGFNVLVQAYKKSYTVSKTRAITAYNEHEDKVPCLLDLNIDWYSGLA